MPQRVRKEPRFLRPRRSRASRAAGNVIMARPPHDLASRIRGLYRRVADRLGLDASYVSRVARGERRSETVEDALSRELLRIAANIAKQRAGLAQKTHRKRKVAKTRAPREGTVY
jgi:hypothetical protein